MKKIFAALIFILLLWAIPCSVADENIQDFNFHDVFHYHGSVLLITDAQTMQVIHANEAAAQFYGYPLESLQTMEMMDLNGMSLEEIQLTIAQIINHEKNSFVVDHHLSDGTTRRVEVQSHPYTSGGKTFLINIVNDITEKILLEKREKNLLSGLIMFVTILLITGFILLVNRQTLADKNQEIIGYSQLLQASMEEKENSEAKLRLLLDSTAEGIYGIDLDGNCTFCNQSCLRLLGYARQEELLGKNMHQLIHYQYPDGTDMPEEQCKIFTAFKAGKGIHVEDEVLWRADGKPLPVSYLSYPQQQDGQTIGAVVTFVDITERKRAQEEIMTMNAALAEVNEELQVKQYHLEEQNAMVEELNSQLEEENERYQQQKNALQAIIDSLGGAILMLDQQGQIVFINESWKRMFSYLDLTDILDRQDDFYIDGNSCLSTELFFRNMLMGIENKDEIFPELINLTTDETRRYAMLMEQSSPQQRFLDFYSNPCISYTGQRYGRVFVARDISHQVEVDRLKMELINTVSHELRTPMSSILGFSELLLTRNFSQEKRQRYLGIINSEAKRLTHLIDEFLDVQRMESGRQEFKKERHSLKQIVAAALNAYGYAGEKHHFVLKHQDAEILVHCDRDKILQVMANLLSNGIKYSPEGGAIIVYLKVGEGYAWVKVTDQGLGIPAEGKDKIFTKFYRVDNDDRRAIGGTGLGLAICKEIIEAHGGVIGVDSIYGQGSTFYFSLPLAGQR